MISRQIIKYLTRKVYRSWTSSSSISMIMILKEHLKYEKFRSLRAWRFVTCIDEAAWFTKRNYLFMTEKDLSRCARLWVDNSQLFAFDDHHKTSIDEIKKFDSRIHCWYRDNVLFFHHWFSACDVFCWTSSNWYCIHAHELFDEKVQVGHLARQFPFRNRAR